MNELKLAMKVNEAVNEDEKIRARLIPGNKASHAIINKVRSRLLSRMTDVSVI